MLPTLDVVSFSQSPNTRLPSAVPRASECRSAHLVGICGSGMKSLATLLLDLGWSISGSDLSADGESVDALRARGIDVRDGHASDNVPPGAQLLIYSAAVPSENPERVAARALGIPERSYSQMLGELMRGRRGIGIAGTHGKSTTAAMTASVLRSAGRDPSACIGAELCGLGNGGWAGQSDLFVAECCEFRRSFLDLSPTYAAILNIESDHFDCFHNFDETRDAFRQFAARVPPNGLLVVHADCELNDGLVRQLDDVGPRIETFALGSPATWLGENLRPTLRRNLASTSFIAASSSADFALRVPGRHNVLNALATIALCRGIGLRFDEIQAGLAEFRGIRRRFEFLGTPNGITWIDDFAHHPTEVRATLETARQRYGPRRHLVSLPAAPGFPVADAVAGVCRQLRAGRPGARLRRPTLRGRFAMTKPTRSPVNWRKKLPAPGNPRGSVPTLTGSWQQ